MRVFVCFPSIPIPVLPLLISFTSPPLPPPPLLRFSLLLLPISPFFPLCFPSLVPSVLTCPQLHLSLLLLFFYFPSLFIHYFSAGIIFIHYYGRRIISTFSPFHYTLSSPGPVYFLMFLLSLSFFTFFSSVPLICLACSVTYDAFGNEISRGYTYGVLCILPLSPALSHLFFFVCEKTRVHKIVH